MTHWVLCLCFAIGLGEAFRLPFPPGLFRQMKTIEDFTKIRSYPPVRRNFEAFKSRWRAAHEDCGHQSIRPYMPHFRIVGGREARPGSWPWMISLKSKIINQIWCAATLIDQQWLVTAAHCFNKFLLWDLSKPSTWTLQLGKYDTTNGVRDETEVERSIGRLYIHPKFNQGGKFNNDIALIRLDEPVEISEIISPLCLPDTGVHFEEGTECQITGWGFSTENDHVLRQASVPLISAENCRKLPNYAGITSNMMCAGFMEGGADTCSGDSGGPIQCQMGPKWMLAGVTSMGDQVPCGQPKTPGVYTDVSKYVDWIYWHLFLDQYF